MAIISFTIPDAQLPRLVAALADRYGVPATGAAAKAAVIADWKEAIQNLEVKALRDAIQSPAAPPIT